VGTYNDGIVFASEKEGVDPDLIRATMYIETTQGYYFGLGSHLDQAGLSKTILPMNINPDLWSDLGTRDQLDQPYNNIAAGAKILKGIVGNLTSPSIEAVATLYNALSATQVSDYGARAAAVYNERPWLK
jgi:soluble lytic murein transglycosylase-like protein